MIKIPKEPDFATKQEGDDHEKASLLKAPSSSAFNNNNNTQQWIRLKDPRIVRVSRAYGGKDRHSKVCTVRGLRDRRVRLSVPTAIQLYDLQERLGFNQPSKVVDWLLNAAKHEIDELPPLPPLNLALIHHNAILTSNSQPSEEEAWEGSSTFWKLESRAKEAWSSGELVEKPNSDHREVIKQGSNQSNECQGVQVMPHHHNNPSFMGLMNSGGTTTMPLLGYQWEGSSSSHMDLQSLNIVPFSSTLSLSTGASSHFAASHFEANMDVDVARPININNHYHQMLMTSSSTTPNLYPMSMGQSLKPFGLSMMTPNSSERHSQNHQDFPSK